jgi:hypothetical protein
VLRFGRLGWRQQLCSRNRGERMSVEW